MESASVFNVTNTLEIHMQKLKRFQEKYPKAFKDESTVLPKSSFSLLSSNDRKELSTIYFNLAKAIVPENDIMAEMSEENKLQALDYLNASISLDFRGNKGIYIMIAKIYAAIKNQVAAYANALIAVESGEIPRNDKFFIEQCKRMGFPTPKEIIRNYMKIKLIDIFFSTDADVVLILVSGTYTIINHFKDKNIVIIGIGEVTIEGGMAGEDCNYMLYNINVESTKGHSLIFYASKLFVGNCRFTKCSPKDPPICIDGRKTSLFMNECIVANSESAGGILLESDSRAYIKNCEIYNFGVSGIEVRYGSSLIAEKNNIHHNKQGVIAWLDAKEVRLIDNIIQNNRSEAILINGNREPALSKKINADEPRQFLYEPPPPSPYTKPSQSVVIIQKNKILKNGSFGVSADFQANVRMEENEIAKNGNSGCFIKGGVDSSLSNNIIHNNGSYGVEIGVNFDGKVIVENNYIHSNKKENISEQAQSKYKTMKKNLARHYKVEAQRLTAPAKLINNKFGNYGFNEQDFVYFNVSSNRPGMHLFHEEQPFLYAIGNTYGFNLLRDSHAVVSETSKTISFDTQKVERKQLSVFLGGIGDLRNLIETVHGLTKSLESHTEDHNINLLFVINDFNPVILARNLVLLKMISELPNPKSPSLGNVESIYNQWNMDFVAGVMQVLSVWAEKILNFNAFRILNDCMDNLIESLEIIVKNKNYDTKKLPSWISFKYSLINTAFSILQTLKYWKDKSYTSATLNWNANQLKKLQKGLKEKQLMPKTDVIMLEKIMKKYSDMNEDIEKYINCQLAISIQALSCDQKHKDMYAESRRNDYNLTMFTVPTMEDDVYPTSSIFRAFQIDTDPSQYEGQQLTLYDHLLLTLLPKFASLRASMHNTSSIQMHVIPVLGDIVDTLLCELPSTVKFNAVDCSNISDYTSLLNILLTSAPRLKNSSLLTLQIMKLAEAPSNPTIEEFIEERFGISLNVFACLTGITLINAYYQDHAVYTTWKFDIAYKDEDKEKNHDILMTHIISVALACCAEHNSRIRGLSINILVRLFQIMIARFSEVTMVQLLQLLFSPEGFKKHIPNFTKHLIELKVFMMLHLPQSMILKIEEFKDFKEGSIARYNVKWLTDKIDRKNETKFDPEKWYVNILRKEGLSTSKINSEAKIWLKLVKPTSISNTKKQKRKKNGSSNNTTDDQEPTCFYLDSVSLNAVNAPAITASFHLPVLFYDTHEDWILECNVGSINILPVAKKITLSEAKQESLNHNKWVDVSVTNKENSCNQCGRICNGFCSKCKLVYYCSIDCQKKDWRRHKTECGADVSKTDDDDEIKNNKENLCKQCGKTCNGLCSKCKSVFYCSIDCQREDWKRHKMECGVDVSKSEENNKTENNKENLCKQCGKTCKELCSKCKSVFYCNIECQRKDWKRHKMECKDAST